MTFDREAEAKRQMILANLMTPEAKERLDRVALVKASNAHEVGNMILAKHASGTLSTKVDEDMLKGFLNAVRGG